MLDVFQPASTVCRPGSGDVCDPDETCTGTGASCSADLVKPSSFECRASAGVCDTAESCSGVATQACPVDVFQPASTVCRPGSGDVCDPNERCTGTGASCPADVVKPSSFECRASAGQCDVPENCSGVSRASCPANGFKPSSAVCDDHNPCTQTDLCSGSSADLCVGTNYAWTGVLPPVNVDGSSIFSRKQGSTVPVKFKLTGSCAGSLTFKISLATISDGVLGTEAEATSTS